MLFPPGIAVTAPFPHVDDAFGEAALTRPPGYVSVNDSEANDIGFGLLIVIVSIDGMPVPTVEGENDFATVGAAAMTFRVADVAFDGPAIVSAGEPVNG